MKSVKINLHYILLFSVVFMLPFIQNITFSINYISTYNLHIPITVNTSKNNSVFLISVVLIYFCIFLYTKAYIKSTSKYKLFLIYYNSSFVSICLLIVNDNVITTLIGWEFLGLTSYLLINYFSRRIKSNKSSLKALFLNKIDDYFPIIFLALVYNSVLTLQVSVFDAMTHYLENKITTAIRLCSVLAAITKSAQMFFSI